MRYLRALLCLLPIAAACGGPATSKPDPTLFVIRTNPPAFVELGRDLNPKREIPLAMPGGCSLGNTQPAPVGATVALELNCAFGPAVVLLNADKGTVAQPVKDSDSHFLAWAADGASLYLRVNSVHQPRIILQRVSAGSETLPMPELTYDISASPLGDALTFAFSRGMGLGSEIWWAAPRGDNAKQLSMDRRNYISLARWSPGGRWIAFIKIPDSATPFTIGELWVMRPDGSESRFLSKADAGHGFAPAWSADGRRIAFVVRGNPGEPAADTSPAALRSDLHVIDIDGGGESAITEFGSARVENAVWSPDGESIAFSANVDDRMRVMLKDVISGKMQTIGIEPVCCAGWLRY